MIWTALGRDRQGLHERAQQSLLSQLVALPTLGLMRLLTEDFRLPLFGSDSARMLDCIRNATQSGLGPPGVVRLWSEQGHLCRQRRRRDS
jgi:hypothetical protein